MPSILVHVLRLTLRVILPRLVAEIRRSPDVNIEVHGNRLAIFGKSKRSENYDKGGYVVQERSCGIRTEDVHAMVENGVLTTGSYLKSVSDEDKDLDECDLGGNYDDDEDADGENGLCLMDVEDAKL
ncbi:hypothetical protein F4604DRAFT_1682311 [Suillus subluteus]|nr:hypothetical protein F4604DRAFT_1682311 [Suillus subluteus]